MINNKPTSVSNWIEGARVPGNSEISFKVHYPGTGELLFETREASLDQIDEAVTASHRAQKVWKKVPTRERGRILIKAAQLIRKYGQSIAELEVWDTGKPISEATEVDVVTAADALEYYGNLAVTLHGDYYSLEEADVYTRVEPLGVCAGIGAWNYPFQIACWKSAPALACGNGFIFKPSELTPLSAVKLGEIYEEAGIPPGLFQVVQGAVTVGRALTTHPGIQKVSFTGEVGTGKKIMADSSVNLKHLTMELGGKSPLIIFPDTDPETAAKAALAANFYTQGEVCTNGTRVFVHEDYLAEFQSALRSRTGNVVLGDPFDPATNVGSLISKEHRELVLSYIRSGLDQGAKPEYLGEIPQGAFAEGYFVQPVVFYDCDDAMKIVQEEIFGPVMSVLTFKTEEEVLERANATEFGLGAGVFTKDISRIQRMTEGLESGMVWVNNYNITPMEMPFGGTKQSGFGKENGLDTLNHYSKRKSVYVSKADVFSPF
ncbi:MAG: betaine-aldehyde dehydrogenase [Leptospira sp.]|nr:betaine-aldehyde dehydrogenase [Leptospira sp.]